MTWVDRAAYAGAVAIAIGTPFLLYWLHKDPRPVRVPSPPRPDEDHTIARILGHLVSGGITVGFYGVIIVAVIWCIVKVVEFAI